MLIEVMLVADDDAGDSTTVTTSVQIDLTAPGWPTRLVDTVTCRAEEGARRLRDQLAAERAIPWQTSPATAFVPLAAVVPTADPGR
jgi:hypothetical protein